MIIPGEKKEETKFSFNPKIRYVPSESCCYLPLFMLIVIIACLLIFAPLQEVSKAGFPNDPDNNACGIGDLQNFPYIYFPNPQKVEIENTNVCVQQCPQASKSMNDLICSPNSSFPKCNDQRYPIYNTIGVLGNMCMPIELSTFKNVSPAFHISLAAKLIANVQSEMFQLFGYGILVGICSFISLRMFIQIGNKWNFLYLSLVCTLAISIIFIRQAILEYPNNFWETNDSIQDSTELNTAFLRHILYQINGNRAWNIFFSVLFMSSTLILIFFKYSIKKSLKKIMWKPNLKFDCFFKINMVILMIIFFLIRLIFITLISYFYSVLFSIITNKQEDNTQYRLPYYRNYSDIALIGMTMGMIYVFIIINLFLNFIIEFAGSMKTLLQIHNTLNNQNLEPLNFWNYIKDPFLIYYDLGIPSIIRRRKQFERFFEYAQDQEGIKSISNSLRNVEFKNASKVISLLLFFMKIVSSSVVPVIVFYSRQGNTLESNSIYFLYQLLFSYYLVGSSFTLFGSIQKTKLAYYLIFGEIIYEKAFPNNILQQQNSLRSEQIGSEIRLDIPPFSNNFQNPQYPNFIIQDGNDREQNQIKNMENQDKVRKILENNNILNLEFRNISKSILSKRIKSKEPTNKQNVNKACSVNQFNEILGFTDEEVQMIESESEKIKLLNNKDSPLVKEALFQIEIAALAEKTFSISEIQSLEALSQNRKKDLENKINLLSQNHEKSMQFKNYIALLGLFQLFTEKGFDIHIGNKSQNQNSIDFKRSYQKHIILTGQTEGVGYFNFLANPTSLDKQGMQSQIEVAKKLKQDLSSFYQFPIEDITILKLEKCSKSNSIGAQIIFAEDNIKQVLEKKIQADSLKNFKNPCITFASLIDHFQLSEDLFDFEHNMEWPASEYANKIDYRGALPININGIIKEIPQPYNFPIGWFGLGINMKDLIDSVKSESFSNKYTLNTWIVLYHATKGRFIKLIFNIGSRNQKLQLKSGPCNAYGGSICRITSQIIKNEAYQNVYFADNITDCLQYADEDGYMIGNKKYQFIFQCRVNPYFVRSPKNQPSYYTVENVFARDSIRPYRLLIKQLDK